ncbi:MAG: response regulator [Cellulosilyticum sp.]|nr:response regulator [Cellulosilyticum sp.]
MISVFLVEDEIVIRDAIQKMVPWGEYGFELVGEAKDGEMALPLIQKLKPDLLITDIKMPFMDGLTLSRLVMNELPETKIIIVSGHDDFEYARQAINLGVEQYILKPISKASFIEVLQNIREKYDKENAQKNYYEKFQKEIKSYEKNSRRDFFEMLVSEEKELQKVYEKAQQLQLSIMAECYNLVLFSIGSDKVNEMIGDSYSQNTADILEIIDIVFQKSKDYLLFRNQMFSYAVLVKGERGRIQCLTEECMSRLQKIFERQEGKIEWFVCAGEPVERLSQLDRCYKIAMKSFAFRYMGYSHIFSYEKYQETLKQNEERMNLENIDIDAMNPDIIRHFLCNGLEDEIEGFTKNYIQLIGEEALRSRLFRQYMMLNVYFSTVSFIQKLGYDIKQVEGELKYICSDNIEQGSCPQQQIANVLKKAIMLREENSRGRYKHLIQTAVQYMKENFSDESLSLNKIACVANVSANHFSALFSQEMKQTFIEYLTGLRMQKAKELLRCTDKRSGEIALEIGYKDAHYFSFLFKKTQGCTPSAYRSQGENKNENDTNI